MVTFVLVVAALVAGVVLYLRHRFSYWQRRGVPSHRPIHLLANFGPVFLDRASIPELFCRVARPFRDVGYCGIYQLGQPLLVVWDPAMVRQIVAGDFASFHDRGLPYDVADPLSANLLHLGGKEWRSLRHKLTPAFSTGKLKRMLPLMKDVADEVVAAVAVEAARAAGREVAIFDIMTRFSADVIGSCAFGIQCHCLRDGNDEFQTTVRQLTERTPGHLMRLLLQTIHPRLPAVLPNKWIYPDVHRFFLKLVQDTVEHREAHGVHRDDFIQIMMQIREGDKALTPAVMTAQAVLFFVAGADNVASILAFCLNRLAADAPLQERLADEVRSVLRRHGGEPSYEALSEMGLAHRVLLEGMRLWSVLGFLTRKCNATTKVGDVVIEQGMRVIVLTDFTHRNESDFPDPLRFDPDRHTADSGRRPYSYLPFGEGPRVCIAERFALIEMKLALAMLVRDFRFEPGPSFQEELELEPGTLLRRPRRVPLCVHVREEGRATTETTT